MENKSIDSISDIDIVYSVNRLLEHARIPKRLRSFDELTKVASSLFVTLFEALSLRELEGVERNPKNFYDYARNAQLVIDGIASRIKIDLHHISGEAIVKGDQRSLSNLSKIFLQIINLAKRKRETFAEFFINEASSRNTPLDGLSIKQLNRSDLQKLSSGLDVQMSPAEVSNSESSTIINLRQVEENYGFNHVNIKNRKFQKSPVLHEQRLVNKKKLRVPTAEDFLRMSSDEISRMLESDVRDEIIRAKCKIELENKVDMARSRKQRLLELQSFRRASTNKFKEAQSQHISHRRFLETQEQEERSFMLRRSSSDSAMLKKIHRAYLLRVKEKRILEQKEAMAKIRAMRESSKQQIAQLSSLFDERVRMLKEESFSGPKMGTGSDFIEKHRRAIKSLEEAYWRGKQRALAAGKEEVSQDRELQMLQRQNIQMYLLQLLTPDWNESLRLY